MDSNVSCGFNSRLGYKKSLNKTAFFYAIFKIFKQFSNNACFQTNYFHQFDDLRCEVKELSIAKIAKIIPNLKAKKHCFIIKKPHL